MMHGRLNFLFTPASRLFSCIAIDIKNDQFVLETTNLKQIMMGHNFPCLIYFLVFQLTKFRKLKGEHGRKPPLMCDNYRPIQPLNDRTVYSVTNND